MTYNVSSGTLSLYTTTTFVKLFQELNSDSNFGHFASFRLEPGL